MRLSSEVLGDGDEAVVFVGSADGDAEASFATTYFGTVADDDAALKECIVETARIGDAYQEEVGITGIDLKDAGHRSKGVGYAATLADDECALLRDVASQLLLGHFQRVRADVVRILDLTEHADDVGTSEGHADA